MFFIAGQEGDRQEGRAGKRNGFIIDHPAVHTAPVTFDLTNNLGISKRYIRIFAGSLNTCMLSAGGNPNIPYSSGLDIYLIRTFKDRTLNLLLPFDLSV